MQKTVCLTSLMLTGVSGTAFAGAVPDAGSLQQQITPSTLPAAPANNEADMPAFQLNEIKDTTRFVVKSIRIVGNQEIDTFVLHDLVKSVIGNALTLTDLQAACAKITAYYQSQGYALTRAILPPQEIDNGEVTIQVIEAKYGGVEIDNKSRVETSLLAATLSPLTSGTAIRQAPLDKSLLLLTDIPGITPNVIMKPGSKTAESDMVVEVLPTNRVTGRAALDNWGNRFINRPRASLNLNVSNLLGYGDVASINYLTTGERMHYARASYDTIINGYGTRVGGAMTHLSYQLGDAVKALDVNGQATTYEAYVRHPILRARTRNLFFTGQYQFNQLEDHIDTANIKTDRDVKSVTLTINGDIRDDFAGGGITSAGLSLTSGQVDFTNAAAAAIDAQTRRTAGQFSKWVVNVNRLQSINDKTQVWLSYTLQRAQDNLDSSQRMVFGGPYSIRAYDNGTLSVDNGELVSLELRRFITEYFGKWQGLAFVDYGRVEVNQQRWPANTGRNRTSLSGAGLGVQWLGPNQLTAKVFSAKTLGSQNSLTEEGDRTITWFEIAKYF